MIPFVSRCAVRIDPTPKPLLFCLIADWLQHCAFWQSCELSLNSESLGALLNNVFVALKMKVALKVESPKNSTVHTFTADYLLLFPQWLTRWQLRRSEIAISFHLLTCEVFVAEATKPLAFIEGKQCKFWRSCRIPQHLQQAEQLQLPGLLPSWCQDVFVLGLVSCENFAHDARLLRITFQKTNFFKPSIILWLIVPRTAHIRV